MDKVHDMGGMHGFGRVDSSDASPYHADWERRVLGIRFAMNLSGTSHGNLRSSIEALPPGVYLTSTYYERWARAVESTTVQAGVLSEQEVASRADAIAAGRVEPPKSTRSTLVHDQFASLFADVANRRVDVRGRFAAGDRVRVKRMSPSGHTRCPRYIRGVAGAVERVTGSFPRPDPGEHPVEQTYTVRFDLRDIWGDDAEKGVLYLDLYEGYLE